ncbi:MAG: O-antigen ligase family protein [Meiothermus sp.]|nr:O-antigen ligase family protein [Meiothermus sp.]
MHRLAYAMIWLYVFTIPWENIITIPGIGTLSRYVGILAVGTALVYLVTAGKLVAHRVHLWGLGFVLLAAASYFWSVDTTATVERLFQYGLLFAFFWLMFVVVDSLAEFRRLLVGYVLGAYVACVNTFQNFFSGSEVVYQRYAAANFDPGDLAFALALAIPMAWYLALTKENSRLVWVYRLYPVVALAVILLTAARAGLLGVAVGLVFVVLTLPRASWQLKTLASVLATAAIVLVPLLVPAESLSRLATLSDEISSGTLNDRTNIWTAGREIWSDNPFLGTGAGTFGSTLENHPMFREWVAPHNIFISISTEMGMVGLVVLLAILAGVFLTALQLPSLEAGGASPAGTSRGAGASGIVSATLERGLWLTTLAILLLACSAQNWEWRKQTWFILGIVLTHHKVLWAAATAGLSGALTQPASAGPKSNDGRKLQTDRARSVRGKLRLEGRTGGVNGGAGDVIG